MDILVNSYLNDGYIYCIHVKGSETVKIGKTTMNSKYNEEEVLSKLLNRYSTYYPDCYILNYIRVGNYHKAEVTIFNLLDHLHSNKEHFQFNETEITNAFNIIKELYPDVNSLVKNTNINLLAKTNIILRKQV